MVHDIFDEHVDKDKDLLSVREVLFGRSNKILLKRKNPYGYWYLSLHSGAINEKYTGAYTTIESAQVAAEQLVNDNRLKNNMDRPKLKYRKTPRKVITDGETATNLD